MKSALAIAFALSASFLALRNVRAQCQDPANLDSSAVASAFIAKLVQRHQYAEVIGGIGQTQASWPMVELRLTVTAGWREHPSPYPGDSASDPLRINVRPQEDPGLAVGTRVLVLLRRVYLEEVRMGDSARGASPVRTGSGMLVLAPCGLRAADSMKATLRALGQYEWRVASP